MELKKTLTIIIACILFLSAKSVIAEGQADRVNDKTFGPIPAELLIQHINSSFGATAAGNNMVDTEMKKELNHISVSYRGQKQNPQYKDMTAIEYRKASFGSNH